MKERANIYIILLSDHCILLGNSQKKFIDYFSIFMEALREVTQSINTFVRFFESINYLFCQLRWFEQNVLNSGSKLLLFVGVIISLCVLMYYESGHGGNPYDALNKFLVDYGPIVLVVTIIAYFISQRLAGAGPSEGGGGTFESVFFGNRRRPNNVPNSGDYDMVDGVDPRFRDLESDRRYPSPSAPPLREIEIVGGRPQPTYIPTAQVVGRNGNNFYR